MESQKPSTRTLPLEYQYQQWKPGIMMDKRTAIQEVSHQYI